MSLLQLFGADSLAERAGSAQDLLLDALVFDIRARRKQKIGKILGWCEALASFCADPFASKGDSKFCSYSGSFFEAVLDRSMWVFAKNWRQSTRQKRGRR